MLRQSKVREDVEKGVKHSTEAWFDLGLLQGRCGGGKAAAKWRGGVDKKPS